MIHSPNQEPQKIEGTINLINPSLKEFKTNYFDDKNNQIEVVIAPFSTKEFPRAIGETVLKHLMNFILNEEGFSYKSDPNIELAKIRERCVLYE